MNIFEAAEKGDINKINELMRQGIDINAANEHGWTALQHAVARQQLTAVEMLLKLGANPNICLNKLNNTAIHTAVMAKNLTIIQALLKAGADVSACNINRETPLHIAAGNDDGEIVKAILTANMNIIDLKENLGCSALNLAIRNGSNEVLEVLLRKGAKVEINDLHTAAYEANNYAIKLLVEEEKIDIDAVDEKGYNSLYYAAIGRANQKEYEPSTIKFLLELGIEIQAMVIEEFSIDLLGE